MSSAAPALEIACAKPDCDWKGSPADAPTHPCPTKAEASAGNPFAGLIDVDGAPIADETADRSLAFYVVWSDGDETRIVGTRAAEDDAIALADSIQADLTRGEVVVKRMLEPEAADAPAQVKADDDPQTRPEIEAWLLEHGSYDDHGIPQDEKTARLDARLSVLIDEAGQEPEPELDEIGETIEGEAVEILEPAASDEEEPTPLPAPEPPAEEEPEPERIAAEAQTDETVFVSTEDPWELQIAAELGRQTGVASYRWLVVATGTDGPVELIGRARTKGEADELLESIFGQNPRADLEVVKTQAVLDRADEISTERDREDVEPETPAETPEPEISPEEADGTGGDTPPPAAGEKGGELFDASAYDREDLQIPKVDGQGIDRIAVGFAGEIMLDRSNADHVALYNRLGLGKDVELRVAGRVIGTGAKGATNREGDLDVVVGKKSVKVETVYVLTPEEL